MYLVPPREGDDSPWPIFERLLATHEELATLAFMLRDTEIKLAFLMKSGELKLHGQYALGVACLPGVQGVLKGLFDQLLEDSLGYWPDFVILLQAEWWAEATQREREILVFHEALHCGQATDKYGAPKFNRLTGQPMPAMIPHDLEEFAAVVRRYGPWKGDVADFLQAADEHKALPPPTRKLGAPDLF